MLRLNQGRESIQSTRLEIRKIVAQILGRFSSGLTISKENIWGARYGMAKVSRYFYLGVHLINLLICVAIALLGIPWGGAGWGDSYFVFIRIRIVIANYAIHTLLLCLDSYWLRKRSKLFIVAIILHILISVPIFLLSAVFWFAI